MKIGGNLSKQLFSTGSDRITLKYCPREYFYPLKFPGFRLRCAGSCRINVIDMAVFNAEVWVIRKQCRPSGIRADHPGAISLGLGVSVSPPPPPPPLVALVSVELHS